VPENQQSDMLLVVSELATNAVIHAQSAFVVVVRQGDDGLGVAVADDNADEPSPRSPSPTREGGRGLRIVQQLTRLWGVLRVPGDGKVVWAKFV
jgi:anti-sigma regulatory factor (Ser/Thr protein kinase)